MTVLRRVLVSGGGCVIAVCLAGCSSKPAQPARPEGAETVVVVPPASAEAAEPAAAPPQREHRSGAVRWRDRPPGSPEDVAEAERAFQRGKELMREGQYDAACIELEKSLERSPALGTLLNLAACSELAGRKEAACTHFLDALEWAKAVKDSRERFVTDKVAVLGCTP